MEHWSLVGEPNGKYSVRGVYVDARDSGVQLLRCLGLRPESFFIFPSKSARVSVSSLSRGDICQGRKNFLAHARVRVQSLRLWHGRVRKRNRARAVRVHSCRKKTWIIQLCKSCRRSMSLTLCKSSKAEAKLTMTNNMWLSPSLRALTVSTLSNTIIFLCSEPESKIPLSQFNHPLNFRL